MEKDYDCLSVQVDILRRREKDAIEYFKKSKFQIFQIRYKKIGPLTKINQLKKHFHKDFKYLSDKELSIGTFDIIVKKCKF